MPRQPRLDIPDLLHHVIVRGIERRVIFMDNTDRNDFVDRLPRLLPETGSDCYAWVLIPNHFHLLLRPGAQFIEEGLAMSNRPDLTGGGLLRSRQGGGGVEPIMTCHTCSTAGVRTGPRRGGQLFAIVP